jgi:hypothetical protein
LRGKKSLTSGMNSHMKIYIESCGIMYSNDVEDDLDPMGIDRRRHVFGGGFLRRRPNQTGRTKR